MTIGLPIPSPSFVPPNATQADIAALPISLVEGRIVNLNNDDDAGSLNFHELKNSLIPPGHLDPSLKGNDWYMCSSCALVDSSLGFLLLSPGPVRDPVLNQTSYCFWNQGKRALWPPNENWCGPLTISLFSFSFASALLAGGIFKRPGR